MAVRQYWEPDSKYYSWLDSKVQSEALGITEANPFVPGFSYCFYLFNFFLLLQIYVGIVGDYAGTIHYWLLDCGRTMSSHYCVRHELCRHHPWEHLMVLLVEPLTLLSQEGGQSFRYLSGMHCCSHSRSSLGIATSYPEGVRPSPQIGFCSNSSNSTV